MALLLVYSDSNAIDQEKCADSFDSISVVVLAQIPNGRHTRKKIKKEKHWVCLFLQKMLIITDLTPRTLKITLRCHNTCYDVLFINKRIDR